MGIDNTAAKMLLLLRNEIEIDFSNTLVLGRQHNYIGPLLRRRIQNNLGISKQSLPLSSKYADEFLKVLGMANPQILDISKYEGATILHDLNYPIPLDLKNRFSTVIDIGTSEHIYNITQALQNLKDLCALKGYLLIVSPANSWLGHGFYQFSPELFFRTFDVTSGFEIRNLFLIKQKATGDVWCELTDPKSRGRRGTIFTRNRCVVAVLAQKKFKEENHLLPQQSDYEPAWEKSSISKIGSLYLKMPWAMRRLIEIAVIPARDRFINRIKPTRFHWKEGRLIAIRK